MSTGSVVHPQDFRVDETWLVFQLNDVPIRTVQHGDFDCLVLMDAASCYIVAQAMIEATADEPSLLECKQLLKEGRAQSGRLPQTLIIPDELRADIVVREAARLRIQVVRMPEARLTILTREARDGFRRHVQGG